MKELEELKRCRMTKAEADQIGKLLADLVRARGMNAVNAVDRAQATLARCSSWDRS